MSLDYGKQYTESWKVNVVNLIIKLVMSSRPILVGPMLVMFYNMYTYKHIHVPIHLPTIDGLKFVSIKDTHIPT